MPVRRPTPPERPSAKCSIAFFSENASARSYILDDQAALRKHMAIFVDGFLIRDRIGLSDPVRDDSEIYVMQALSGG